VPTRNIPSVAGKSVTTRNWPTVLKLSALSDSHVAVGVLAVSGTAALAVAAVVTSNLVCEV
jgi:hypothetical protein